MLYLRYSLYGGHVEYGGQKGCLKIHFIKFCPIQYSFTRWRSCKKVSKNGYNLSQPMRMSWMNPWAFCPLLISAVGILLTTEVPSVNQYSYLPLNNPLVIY